MWAISAAPRHPPKHKLQILWKGLFKTEGRPFGARVPTRSMSETKLDPKLKHKSYKKSIKICKKSEVRENNDLESQKANLSEQKYRTRLNALWLYSL